ncbi:MAG: hypothetical protein ABI858_11390 [Pseudoxanthomonas sp.]
MKQSAGTFQQSRAPDAIQALRERRALQLLLATGTVMVVLGLGWGLFFLAQDARLVAMSELGLAGLGIAVIVAARMQRVRMSSWLAFIGLFVFLCLFSAQLDVQTADIPRSSHLFLLVLAACAHYVFRAESPWLRYGCVSLFLIAFIVFAALPECVPVTRSRTACAASASG